MFPGAVVAICVRWCHIGVAPHAPAGEPTIASRLLTITALLVTASTVGLLGRLVPPPALVRITSLSRYAAVAGAAGVLIFTLSSRARVGLLAWSRSPAAVFSLLTLFAVIMSFDRKFVPWIASCSKRTCYALFYASRSRLRRPSCARTLGMIVMLGLALPASLGLQRFSNRRPSLSRHARLSRSLQAECNLERSSP